MRDRILILLSTLMVLLLVQPALAQDDDNTDADQEASQETEQEEKELKLEDLFKDESHFGTSASQPAFSRDGRYAAFLYRPYIERRHSNDLWILDTETGEVERLTSASVMAAYQESTREVVKDREEKARKAGIGKKKSGDAEDDDAQADQETESETGAVTAPNAVTGVWEGKVIGGEDFGMPPGGVDFKLIMQLQDDNSVTGWMTVMGQRVDLSGGTYDAGTDEVTASLVSDTTGEGATLRITIAEGNLSGSVSIDQLGITLDMEGKRTSTEIDEEESQGNDTPQDQDEGDDDTDNEGQEEDDDTDDQQEENIILGDWVSEKDADDRQAPRYSGISSYVWAPDGHEMIFTSQGDLYRFNIDTREITRLTSTDDSERGVQYLPDGSGYTYSGEGGLRCIRFGSHLIEEFDPAIGSGENMFGYEISPDGRRMVFITSRSTGNTPQQTVNIMTFRSRFAQVRQVSRQVSDDPRSKTTHAIYLYDFGDPWTENRTLKKVFTHEVTGPRDILQTPEWAPDSSKVVWAVYTQATGLVEVYQAGFEQPKEGDEEDNADSDADADNDNNNAGEEDAERGRRGGRGDGRGRRDGGDNPQDDDAAGDDDVADDAYISPDITDARLVYKFFHNGGPTTPGMVHPYFLADSHRVAFVTEISGFRHLHVLDPTYESLQQVTSGRYEVYPFDLSDDHRYMFVTATREHPTREDVYAVDLESGEMKRITRTDGVYSSRTTAVSDDAMHAIAQHATFGDLPELEYIDVAAETQREITDSHPESAWEVIEPTPEFFTYKNRHGHEIHGHMFKPDNWSADREWPLLIYVYGGPLGTRKQVVDGSYSSASYFFAYYMAKKHGYVTVTIDPRGVSGFGAVFEKANYENVGKPQTEDLVDGVKWLTENASIDPKRVGMHGWSFGGFQTQMCMYTEPDVFQVGIAGAGPTEWENYNQWYSTGTIFDTTAVGEAELEKWSLLPLAKNLKGRLLLIHGMEDSNVLYQDTVKLYRELLKAGKETNVELFLDPTGGHGLGGDVKTLNRYRKYEDFLLRYLGAGPTEEEAEEEEEEEAN